MERLTAAFVRRRDDTWDVPGHHSQSSKRGEMEEGDAVLLFCSMETLGVLFGLKGAEGALKVRGDALFRHYTMF